jgi:hypothetical protein
MSDEARKDIDEAWKEAVAKEKEKSTAENTFIPQEPDFNFFVTTLALQASIFLGAMVNPATNKKEENLPQAKFIIDTIGMLRDKSKGNLTKEEDTLIENVLYELRLQFIAQTKENKPSEGGTA